MNNLHILIEEQFNNYVISRIGNIYKPKCFIIDKTYDNSILINVRIGLSFINGYSFSLLLKFNNLDDFDIFIEDIKCNDIDMLSYVLVEVNNGLKYFKPYIKSLLKAHYGNLGLI